MNLDLLFDFTSFSTRLFSICVLFITPGVFHFRYTVTKHIAGIPKCVVMYVAILILWILTNPHLSVLYSSFQVCSD